MYGTQQKMKVKSGGLEVLKKQMEASAESSHGAVAMYVYQMDANQDEFYTTIIFVSK